MISGLFRDFTNGVTQSTRSLITSVATFTAFSCFGYLSSWIPGDSKVVRWLGSGFSGYTTPISNLFSSIFSNQETKKSLKKIVGEFSEEVISGAMGSLKKGFANANLLEDVKESLKKTLADSLEATLQNVQGSIPQMLERIKEPTVQFLRDVAEGTFQNARDSIPQILEQIKEPTAQFLRDAAEGSGKAFQEGLKDLRGSIPQILEQIKEPTAQFLRDAAKGSGKAFQEGLKDLRGSLRDALGDILKEIEKGATEASAAAGRTAANTMKAGTEPVTDAIGDIVGSLFRNITLNSVPYIASALVTITGAPLLARYTYKRAEQNLGKPQLAIETKHVGTLDRLQAGMQSTALESLKTLSKSVQAAAITTVVAMAAFFPLGIALSFNGYPMMRYEDRYLNGSALAVGTAAFIVGGLDASRKLYSLAKTTFFPPRKPKAIFNQEITSLIKDISKGLQNVVKHGGSFQNILLYGPGGTGKTLIAMELAKNSGMNYIRMSGSDFSKFIQRKEHIIELNRLFESLNQSHTPTILFIDEADAFAGKRDEMTGNDKSEYINILNTFLTHTGTASNNFMIICATNRPDLDEAFLSRMDEKIAILPPALEQRIEMIKQNIELVFEEEDREEFFPEDLILEIAKRSESLSGRALEKMINAVVHKQYTTDDFDLERNTILEVVDRFVSQERKVANYPQKISLKPVAPPAA